MSRSHFRFYATTLGVLVLAVSSYQLWRLWEQPVDAYWTPPHLAMSLESTSDRFAVLVGGVPLAKALQDQTLAVSSGGNVSPLAASDVLVRVNDYERMRLMRVPSMVALSAAAGGAFVLLVIGLFTPLIGAFRPHGMVDLHLTET